MCPHFETDTTQCGLLSEDEWDNLCTYMELDFMLENYCEAEEYTSTLGDPGEDNTGFKNCGTYKLKAEEAE